MEANELPLTLEDRALQIVVEDRARHPAERVECGEVATEEALGGLVEVEAGEEGAAPRQHHEEARQSALGATYHDRAEGRPVDLGLLTRQDRQTQERLVLRGPDARDEATHGEHRPRIPPIAEHLVQACGSQTGVLLERQVDEAAEGVEHLRANAELGREKRTALDRAMNSVVVKAELGGNGADLPMLGEEESPDRGALRVGDHRATSSMRSFRRSSNSPIPAMSRRRARRPCSSAGIQSRVYRGPPTSANVSRKRLASDPSGRTSAHSAARIGRPCQRSYRLDQLRAIARGCTGEGDSLALRIVS